MHSRWSSFIFTNTAPSELSTLSLHDALPISPPGGTTASPPRSSPANRVVALNSVRRPAPFRRGSRAAEKKRSEEHTSELQSRPHLVCRLLLEKKKQKKRTKQTGCTE